MHNIDIAHLVKSTGSSFKLVTIASRRAIELSEGAARLIDCSPKTKAMNVAIDEIAAGKISYKIKTDK